MIEYDEELVEEIINNVDLVDFISEYVPLEKRGNDYFGICPFHDEDTASFSVTPQKHAYYCFGCGCGGNAYTFCREYLKMSKQDSIEYLAEITGISAEQREISPSVKFFRQLKRAKECIPIPEQHRVLNKNILKRFEHENIIEWEKEGIPQSIMDKYGVAYDRRIDSKLDRIIYPVYDIDGNLINVKGRTLCKNYKDFKFPKYINYYAVGDLDYLQGLNFKYDEIKKCGEMIIFESFKSVMKAESYGCNNAVSAETSKITVYQMKLIIGLHVDVVIAFDTDVPLKKIKENENISLLSHFTNCYVIHDKNHLLGDISEKNSPVDCGSEIWNRLYEEKVKL